jgi:hypothetical protein
MSDLEITVLLLAVVVVLAGYLVLVDKVRT